MGAFGQMPSGGATPWSLKRLFPRCVLLTTDEISMLGAQQFAAAGMRSGAAKSDPDIFGGMGVALFGDSGKLRPVGQKTLLAPMAAEGERFGAKLSNDGVRIFDTPNECARLRVIYRQGAPCLSESQQGVCATPQ